jgi:preprotein translocase subunit SecG
MATLVIIIHVLAALFLIAIVLLQGGKGAEMGAAFGGSSQTLFGSRGAATVLSKITTISAVVFMLTSLALTVVTTKGTSVINQNLPVKQQNAAPQLPQQPIGQQPQTQPPVK